MPAIVTANCGGNQAIARSMAARSAARVSSAISVSWPRSGVGGRIAVKWARQVAELSFDGGSVTLPRAVSASGARHADDRHEIWEHQGKLRWNLGDGPPRICRRTARR